MSSEPGERDAERTAGRPSVQMGMLAIGTRRKRKSSKLKRQEAEEEEEDARRKE